MVIPVGPPGAQHVIKAVKQRSPDGEMSVVALRHLRRRDHSLRAVHRLSSSIEAPRAASARADQNPRRQHQRAADHHLGGRRERRRVHVPPLDPGDCEQLDDDHDEGDDGRGVEARDQKGQGVADAAAVVIRPQTRPRSRGAPRPESLPSSDSASAKPIEMPAPIEAASPTTKGVPGIVGRETPRRTPARASTPSRPSGRPGRAG